MKRSIIYIIVAITMLVSSFGLGAVYANGGKLPFAPDHFAYVDATNTPDGQPHWVIQGSFPLSGTTFWWTDPTAIPVTGSTDAAAWFPGTDSSDWHSIQEGEFVAWVFHSNNGQTKNLSVPFGTLQVSATSFLNAGQVASTQDATWRFGNRNAATTAAPTPAPQPAPAPTGGALTACPTTSDQAALMGGSASAWNVIPSTRSTGWHYEGPSALLAAPGFGRLDTPAGGLRNGQSTRTTVATFWCQG